MSVVFADLSRAAHELLTCRDEAKVACQASQRQNFLSFSLNLSRLF
jgi:hypothetical protein